MLVDYERAFLELRSSLLAKNSWGQRELLALLTRIEVDCRLSEGERDFDPLPFRSKPSVEPLREAARHG
jgi:hypothetical protein